MKLKDIIYDIIQPKTSEILPFISDTTLYGEQLFQYKDILSKCEEFSSCDMLNFVAYPMMQNVEGKVLQAQTYHLKDNMKFKGRCFVLSIFLSPEVFEPTKIHEPVKDNACISPTFYHPESFTPYRDIVLRFSPEQKQDLQKINGEDTVKKELHKLLDNILENPSEYVVKGTREIMVRGFFEKIETIITEDTKVETTSLDDFTMNENFPLETFIVYYLSYKSVNDKEIGINVEHKLLPIRLKEKFTAEFTPKGIITEEELDKFLKENE